MVQLGISGIGDAVMIGAGGSAVVFAALKDDGTPVAVKLLRMGAADAQARAQFKREAEAIERLSAHESIVPVLGSGSSDRGEPFLLMPLMEGSAQQVMDDHGPLQWKRALELILLASDAIDFAHSKDVIHRDIKPANILLDARGRPFVADFGIAKLVDDTQTMSSGFVVTPSYAPPELYRGEVASKQSDVYSLGATFMALVTGQRPFNPDGSATPEAVMRRVLDDAPIDLATAGVGVPAEVAAVITKAMAKQPGERHASAAEFAEALERASALSRYEATRQVTIVLPTTPHTLLVPAAGLAPTAAPEVMAPSAPLPGALPPAALPSGLGAPPLQPMEPALQKTRPILRWLVPVALLGGLGLLFLLLVARAAPTDPTTLAIAEPPPWATATPQPVPAQPIAIATPETFLPATAPTPVRAPGADPVPVGILQPPTVTDIGPGSLTLNWEPSAQGTGGPVSYSVTVSAAETGVAVQDFANLFTHAPLNVAGLTPATTYRISLSASDDEGSASRTSVFATTTNGDGSAAVPTVADTGPVPLTSLGFVESLRATDIGQDWLSVSWEPPTGGAGGPVTYDVSVAGWPASAGSLWTRDRVVFQTFSALEEPMVRITDLNPGIPYTVNVAANEPLTGSQTLIEVWTTGNARQVTVPERQSKDPFNVLGLSMGLSVDDQAAGLLGYEVEVSNPSADAAEEAVIQISVADLDSIVSIDGITCVPAPASGATECDLGTIEPTSQRNFTIVFQRDDMGYDALFTVAGQGKTTTTAPLLIDATQGVFTRQPEPVEFEVHPMFEDVFNALLGYRVTVTNASGADADVSIGINVADLDTVVNIDGVRCAESELATRLDCEFATLPSDSQKEIVVLFHRTEAESAALFTFSTPGQQSRATAVPIFACVQLPNQPCPPSF